MMSRDDILRLRLLRSVGCNHIHELWAERVVSLQPVLPQPISHFPHVLGVKALLEYATHKGSELRLLPVTLVAKLDMNKVQAFERMVLLDSAEHMRAAGVTSVALDHGIAIHDIELVSVGGNGELLARDHSHDTEERGARLPAFRASASMVVHDIRVQIDDNTFAPSALARQRTASLSLASFLHAAVNQRVQLDRCDCPECGRHST